jgi:hypothetical protein
MLVSLPGDMIPGPLGISFTPIGTRFREGEAYPHTSPTEYDAEMEHP